MESLPLLWHNAKGLGDDVHGAVRKGTESILLPVLSADSDLYSLSQHGSLVLTERGDMTPIKRHPGFRLFACMNPATDVGKRDLPPGMRSRFTEIYVDEVRDQEDLMILVQVNIGMKW